jgi:short-subunit dehydrogenase
VLLATFARLDPGIEAEVHVANTRVDESSSQFAVVTGASSGIGFELAKVFAEHGFDLLINAENQEIESAAEQLRRLGHKVDTVRADLATYDGVETLYNGIQQAGRPVDAIAINAGVGSGGRFADTDLDKELNLIALNVTSVVHLAKRVVRDMVARNEGRILFTSSIAAEAPGPFEAVYAASKAFVQSFSEALRNELKDTNIVVTALQPGATETNFFERAEMMDTKVATQRKSDAGEVARQGFEALMKGKDHVVAAMPKEKAQVMAGKVLPETTAAQQHRKMSEPGSAKQ